MDWYDRAEAYDILCGWDPGQERDFVLRASERYGLGAPGRVLEPFCGSGRLLRVMPGFATGFDRNPHMVRYARGKGSRVFRADAAAFAVRPGSFDLAYCLIDSFRHLPAETAARAHVRAVARALRPGGVYVLGLDVTGDLEQDVSSEAWGFERDGTRVDGELQCLGDRAARIETMRVKIDIKKGRRRERLEVFQPMRVYARADVRSLLKGAFEIAGVFDRAYDIGRPVPFDSVAGSAVLVLRNRRGT